jgi:GNAT superfamily N-acetyltransferase
MSALRFIEVNSTNKFIAKELLAEYGSYLYDDLKHTAGRESFFNELEKFPDDKYLSPKGVFFVIYKDETPIGCASLKRFDDASCELKRMYIRDQYRGNGYAKIIIAFMAETAALLGYERLLLDTHVEMPAAVNAYIKAGFVEIPAYCENENKNPLFYCLILKNISKND